MTATRQKREHEETVASVVYERLLDMVVRLELEPGSVVSEALLADRLRTGRSTLRDALRQLGRSSTGPRARLSTTCPGAFRLRACG